LRKLVPAAQSREPQEALVQALTELTNRNPCLLLPSRAGHLGRQQAAFVFEFRDHELKKEIKKTSRLAVS
jgi:hypothetical protein